MHLLGALLERQGQPLSTSRSSTSTRSATVTRTSATGASKTSGPSTSLQTVTRPTPSPTSITTSGSSSNDGNTPSNRQTTIIGISVAIAVLFAVFSLFLLLRRTRRRHKNPKYVPTPYLKRLWQKWEPATPAKLPRNNGHLEPIGTAAARRLGPSAAQTESNSAAAQSANGSGGTGDIGTARVDRNTSVRSVMTLPAYRPNAHQNEQVLGREGERGGIDMVLEFPETQDEEERQREEEMEALYQVRLARRRENEERDERRRLRREARERGDTIALRDLQARARASSSAAAGRSVDELRAEHERLKRERNRAVSSVSYADLGVARHDGTRVRANSEESERTGLLGDAASFAASSQYHRRDRSASSVISIDTMNSDLPSPGFTRARGNSQVSQQGSSLRRGSTQEANDGRAGSSPEMIELEDAPQNSPPEYEQISLNTPSSATIAQPTYHNEPPPDYTSPTLAHGEGISRIDSQIPVAGEGQTSDTGRRSSTHIGHMPQERRESSTESHRTRQSHSPATRVISHERGPSSSPGRGVGGAPQLPSLRLANLPSIQVDPGSPSTRKPGDRGPES